MIRPSFHTFRNRFFLALVVCGFVAVVDVLALHHKPAQQEFEAVAFALLAIAFGLVTLLVFQREELNVSNGILTRRNMFGIPTRYPLASIGGVTRRDVMYVGSPQPARLLIVFNKEHRCLFKMNRVIWDPSDVRRLHARLGGDGRTQLITSGELATEFPGSVPWVIEHPLSLFAFEAVVLIAVVVGLVALIDALPPR